MNERTSQLRARLLRRYYKSALLGWFKPRTVHWAKIVTASGYWKWIKAHRGLRGRLLKQAPVHIYQMLLPFRTEKPPRGNGSSGYLLGNRILFDMDLLEKWKPLTLSKIQDSANAINELTENLIDRGYSEPKNIVFSGHRGIHVYSGSTDSFQPIEIGEGLHRSRALTELKRERYQVARSVGKWCRGWDWKVSADIWRVVRVPWSIHGKSALVAMRFSKPFTSRNMAQQLADCSPFTFEHRIRVRMKRAIDPFTFIDGETYGPFPKHWPTKLPIGVALHLIWLDSAKPREDGPSQSSRWFRKGWQILFRRKASTNNMETTKGRGGMG